MLKHWNWGAALDRKQRGFGWCSVKKMLLIGGLPGSFFAISKRPGMGVNIVFAAGSGYFFFQFDSMPAQMNKLYNGVDMTVVRAGCRQPGGPPAEDPGVCQPFLPPARAGAYQKKL